MAIGQTVRSLKLGLAVVVAGLVVTGVAQAAPGSAAPGSKRVTVVQPELSSAQARRANRIVKNVMSPDCPHLTVAACPSDRAAAWRADVRGWVAAGVSTEAIMQRLQQRAPFQDLTGQAQGNSPLPVFVLLAGAAALVPLVCWRRRVAARIQHSGEEAEAQSWLSPSEALAPRSGAAQAESQPKLAA